MDLASPRLTQHANERPLRVAADDRIVDDDKALARNDIAEGIELEPNPELANRLGWLNEGSSDVGVLH